MKLQPIFYVIGYLLLILSALMLWPLFVEIWHQGPDIYGFISSFLITNFTGISLILVTHSKQFNLSIHKAFLLTTLSWTILGLFSALPFLLVSNSVSLVDACFEAMSGITTTGSTIIQDIEAQSYGLLLWRAILQWLGGIGIIVMAVAIMPLLQVGGMQIFRTESSDRSEKLLPRVNEFATQIGIVYIFLTVACMIAYHFAGMHGFDALCHAMTTIATGGYSTKNASIGHFNSTSIEMIGVIFMIIGSLPFILYLKFVKNGHFNIFGDSQVRWFFMIALMIVIGLTLWNFIHNEDSFGVSLRISIFNAISIMTGTGYATSNYSLWGAFPLTLFFIIMFIGGCAGSTTCGLKIFRVQVLFEAARMQLKRLVHPRAVVIGYYDKSPLPDAVLLSVMGFFFIYVVSFAVLCCLMGMCDLNFITAVSSAATAIANVGPGLGDVVGPSGHFATLPDMAKWLMILGMLVGRLEFFTFIVVFARGFWRG